MLIIAPKVLEFKSASDRSKIISRFQYLDKSKSPKIIEVSSGNIDFLLIKFE